MTIVELWRLANSSNDMGVMTVWLRRMKIDPTGPRPPEDDITGAMIWNYAYDFDSIYEIKPADRNPRYFVRSFANEYGLDIPG